MNKRILIKQMGYKSTVRLKDYYGARIDEDRPEFLKEMRNYVEAKTGDLIFICSLEPPKLKKKIKSKYLTPPELTSKYPKKENK